MNRSALKSFGARLRALGLDHHRLLAEIERCEPSIEEVPARFERRRSGHPRSFDILLSGWAFRFRHLRDGTRHIAGLILTGEPCDIDVVEMGESDFQLGTLTRCVVARIDREAFRALCDRDAEVRRAVSVLAMAENAMLREWSLCLAHRSAPQRMAHLFCELHARLLAVGEADSSGFEFPLTQAHLAELLGLTSVHVNRTLQALRADRLIELSDHRLVVPDWKALAALADFNADYLRLEAVAG